MAAAIISVLVATQLRAQSNPEGTAMANPLLEINVDHYDFTGQGWRIDYSLTSRSSTPLFLVEDPDFPFIRFRADPELLEVWLGVPPRSAAETNLDINALILPSVTQIDPGSTQRESVDVKWPLTVSGYWLTESDGPVLPLDPYRGFSAVVVKGFGTGPMDPLHIRSIEDLFAWQTTVRSGAIILKAPSRQ